MAIADLETQLTILARLSTENLESRIVGGRFSNLQILLDSISAFPGHDFPPLMKLTAMAVFSAVWGSNYDILEGIVKRILPKSNVERQLHADWLRAAAMCSHLADFELLASIPTRWTAHHGHFVFDAILKSTGPSQYEIAETWLAQLDNLGILKEAVNYIASGCTPKCKQPHYTHDFAPSLFASAVLEDCQDIARLIEPHIDHDMGAPTGLFHVLNDPSTKTLHRIDFLMNLGPEHRKYVCYPIYNRTALQVVAKENGEQFQCCP